MKHEKIKTGFETYSSGAFALSVHLRSLQFVNGNLYCFVINSVKLTVSNITLTVAVTWDIKHIMSEIMSTNNI